MPKFNRHTLDNLYHRYNKRELIHPDPLEFLHKYDSNEDLEVVGLIASSLAYGRVLQILKSASFVLDKLGGSPKEFLLNTKDQYLHEMFVGFKHRFTTDYDIVQLLINVKNNIQRHGSLNKCFLHGYNDGDENVIPAMIKFVEAFAGNEKVYLLPHPERGSACKRLNLYLRWMVRSDDVDPGCWSGIPKSKLIVPLDTHMHKISLKFGLTNRKQANLKTAIEVSSNFARINPDDPIKYDFALTRFGIRDDMALSDL
ncbi:TIGR02757 family protein [bacterium]|nr:TIGR02757 family protein [bacterium]